jgi:hypothetical protein
VTVHDPHGKTVFQFVQNFDALAELDGVPLCSLPFSIDDLVAAIEKEPAHFNLRTDVRFGGRTRVGPILSNFEWANAEHGEEGTFAALSTLVRQFLDWVMNHEPAPMAMRHSRISQSVSVRHGHRTIRDAGGAIRYVLTYRTHGRKDDPNSCLDKYDQGRIQEALFPRDFPPLTATIPAPYDQVPCTPPPFPGEPVHKDNSCINVRDANGKVIGGALFDFGQQMGLHHDPAPPQIPVGYHNFLPYCDATGDKPICKYHVYWGLRGNHRDRPETFYFAHNHFQTLRATDNDGLVEVFDATGAGGIVGVPAGKQTAFALERRYLVDYARTNLIRKQLIRALPEGNTDPTVRGEYIPDRISHGTGTPSRYAPRFLASVPRTYFSFLVPALFR